MSVFKVFISYSWCDSEKRSAVYNALKSIDQIEIDYDDKIVGYDDDNIWKKIYDGVSEADAIIVLLTKSSMSSSAVLDEVARAHDRGLSFITVVEKDEDISSGSESHKIPVYLRYKKHLMYSSGEGHDAFVDDLSREVRNIAGKGPRLALKELSKLRNIVTGKSCVKVLDMVLSRVISQAGMEASDILKQSYEINLGTEFDFLNRAAPLFASAQKVFAITISSVSSFWTDYKNISNAVDYLLAQKGEIIRIFVFDSPVAMLKYREILDANYCQYGDRGGAVFVTSVERYLSHIVNPFSGAVNKCDLLKSDFGVLEYGGQNKLFAWLRDSYLGFRPSNNPPKELLIDVGRFRSSLRMMKAECRSGYSDKFNVWLWDGEMANRENLKKCVETFFGEAPGSVVHLVLFKKYDEELASVIARVRHNISSLTDYYGVNSVGFNCDDVWYGQNMVDLEEYDAYTRGVLRHDKEYRYLLYMRLPTKADLHGWYQYEKHSLMREEIYVKLVKSVRSLYDRIRKLKKGGQAIELTSSDVNVEIKKIYSEIEARVSKKMVRMDYQDIERVESMMSIHPYPFLEKYKSVANVESFDTAK